MAGAAAAAERAAMVAPGHPEAFALLEHLLAGPEGAARLARRYFESAAKAKTPEDRLTWLRRASELLHGDEAPGDLAVEVGSALLALDPAAERVRQDVIQRLIARGRHKDVVDQLEAALKREPPPGRRGSRRCSASRRWTSASGVLRDPQRALLHVEGLLVLDATHPHARKLAEELVEHRQLGLRAAAALSNAYEATGEIEKAVAMLSFELKQVRGSEARGGAAPARHAAARRARRSGRRARATRARWWRAIRATTICGGVSSQLSLELDQSAQAARLLSRALTTSRDPAVRARVAADVGEVYLQDGRRPARSGGLPAGARDRRRRSARRSSRRPSSPSSTPKRRSRACSPQSLEIVVKLEPEREERQTAARRLARLSEKSEGEEGDPARAVLAWQALIGSPWNDEALDRLEALYGESGDEEGLADVLAQRADSISDPAEARAVLFRAAAMRSERPRDRPAAIAAWFAIEERYGQSHEIDERLLAAARGGGPLRRRCEPARAACAPAAPAEEREVLNMRLAELRLSRLGDHAGALAAFSEVLRQKPEEPQARAALERLLGSGDVRLGAADVLEPIYRSEGNTAGLVKVLEARAELATGDQVFIALREALGLAENVLEESRAGARARGLGARTRGVDGRAHRGMAQPKSIASERRAVSGVRSSSPTRSASAPSIRPSSSSSRRPPVPRSPHRAISRAPSRFTGARSPTRPRPASSWRRSTSSSRSRARPRSGSASTAPR